MGEPLMSTLSAETKQTKDQANDLPCCDRCGSDCQQGMYEIRYFGPRDRETGYQDEEVVCIACLEDAAEQAAMDDEDDERYAEADRKFTARFEESGFEEVA